MDGVFSAPQVKPLFNFPSSIHLNPFFRSHPLLSALGFVALAGVLWFGKLELLPGDPHMIINGISVKTPQTEAEWRLYTYNYIISSAEARIFQGIGICPFTIKVNPVTGWYPMCYYYRHSFIYDFKQAYLDFHHLGT